MTGATHAAIGAALGAAVARLAGGHDLTLVLAGAAGGLLPDADQPGSRAHRHLIPYAAATVALSHFVGMPVPRPLSTAAWIALAYLAAGLLSHHRGITHSLVALAAIGLWLLAAGAGLHGLALWLGIAGHVAADTVTPEGTRLLWPAGRRISLPLVRTGGWADLAAGLACAVLTAMLLV